MKSLRMILCVVAFLTVSKSYATTYYICSSGTWNGASSTALAYTTSNCSGGSTNINSISWSTGDILVIESGVTIVVSNNQSIGNNSGPDITIDVFGNLYFATGSNPGKLSLSTNSTIKLEPSSTISCTSDGGASTTTCSSSDQVNIGNYKYAGTDINAITSPSSMTSSGAVPVELTSFRASADANGVSLNWTTASEINFDYFSLQRSIDGGTFNEITQVKGHGTTNEIHYYSYEDMDPIIGRSYYRLTSNDFDGYKETFQVILVDYHGGKKFHIYSNPSDGASINLHFNFETDTDAMVTIYDNLGFVVGSFPARTETIVFANALKSGVYVAKYQSESFTKAERFFVK